MLVNRQAEVLFGYAREELLGEQVELLVPEGVRSYHREHRVRYAGEPRVRAMGPGLDLHARRKDGVEFPVEISLGPVRIAEDILTSAVIRDTQPAGPSAASARTPRQTGDAEMAQLVHPSEPDGRYLETDKSDTMSVWPNRHQPR